MNASGQLVCLNMIVKNESDVIRRCLDSVRTLIDYWVIVDTGSSDGTQDVIRTHLHNIPGELHERPWQNFASNRSEALTLARDKGEYILIIDADDTLEIAHHGGLPTLVADSYALTINDVDIVYQRPQLVRNALNWRYEGVLHEYLTCDDAALSDHLSGIAIRRNHDGARRKDPQTYRRDVALLETALQTEHSPFLIARYRFYLAQSYRDCQLLQQALDNYQIRAELGFWQEEVYISLYCAAQLKEQLEYPDEDILNSYVRAAESLPTRAEALYQASRFCRQKERYEEGYQLAARGLAIPMRADALFVEPRVHEFGLLDELSLNAYWSGHNRASLDAALQILATAKLSTGEMRRVVANAQFASNRLPSEPKLGSLGAETFIAQHAIPPPRLLHSKQLQAPFVFLAILATQDEASLPLYLACIEALEYPKSAMALFIRVHNSTDGTAHLLREWVGRIGKLYANVDFEVDAGDLNLENDVVQERDLIRSRIAGFISNSSLRRATELACTFYFVVDTKNFIRPCTLRELVALDLTMVAPFLRSVSPLVLHSNYHAAVDANGYYAECDQYGWLINRLVCGVIEVPVINGTVLIRGDLLNELTYEDGTARHSYVILAETARQRQIQQYLDNRQLYGYLLLGDRTDVGNDDDMTRASVLLNREVPHLTSALTRSP